MGKLDSVPYVQLFALVAHWTIFFNSCINPVVYNFMSGNNTEFYVLVFLFLDIFVYM